MAKLNEPENTKTFAQIVQELDKTDDISIERAKINIAEIIYLTMKKQDVSKAELSRRLGKSRAYVTQILQGGANFTIESLVRISTALHSQLDLKLIPKCTSPHWDYADRNMIQSVYPCWGDKSDYVPAGHMPPVADSEGDALLAEAA